MCVSWLRWRNSTSATVPEDSVTRYVLGPVWRTSRLLSLSTSQMLVTTSGWRTRNRYRSGSQSVTWTGIRRKMLVADSTALTLARACASSFSKGMERAALWRAPGLVLAWKGLARSSGAGGADQSVFAPKDQAPSVTMADHAAMRRAPGPG